MDEFGFAVALSGDGSALVAGAPKHDEDEKGQVQAFDVGAVP